jgi:FkbM family methyltransferase
MAKKLVKKIVRKLGYDLIKSGSAPMDEKKNSAETMNAALRRLKKLGISPNTIIDVGAASGNWSKEVHELWPESFIIAFEPLKEQTERFHKNTASFKDKVKLCEAVAGDAPGEIEFTITDDPDGSGVYAKGKGQVRKLPVITLNDASKEKQAPFLIKLDTHGYEFPILNGADKILPTTDVIIVEVYGFYVSPTAPLFHQISVYLEEKGFRLFDLVDVMRRKKDEAFWQADAVYLRANHPLFSDNNYR